MTPPTATIARPLSMVKRLLILAVCALLLVPGAAAASPAQPAEDEPYQDVELQARTNLLVNDEGFNLPPGSSFTSTTPDINNNAEVAFRVQQVADPSPTDMQGGVWLGGQGEGEIVHLTGDLDPGDVGMNNDGDFAFSATVGLGTSHLYLYSAAEQDAERIVPDPILPNSFSGPKANDAGDIGFQASLAPGRIFGGYIDGEGVTYVQDSGVNPESPYTFLHGAAFNNVGQIAAKVATSGDQFTDVEIQLFEEDGSSELVIANDETDPDSPYSEFDNSVAVNDDGVVAAIARRASDGIRTVIRVDDETVTEIAEISEDGPIFDLDFFPPDINNEGQVVFRADDDQGQAIYVGDGDELTRVVGDGDVVETDRGTGQLGQHDDSPVFGGAPSINDHGDIVFTAGLHPEGDDQTEWGTGVMVAYAGIEQDPVLESVVVEPDEASVEVSDTIDLTATAHYDDGSSDDVTDEADWTSENEDVATVDAGTVTGVGEGESDVTAEFGGQSDVAEITVETELVLDEVVVTPESATVAPEESVQLTAEAFYEDVDDPVDVTDEADWSSDDTEVATVDDEGLVTGVGDGDTDVTAEFEGQTGSADVFVESELVLESVEVDPDEVHLEPGESEQLTALAHYADVDEPVDVTDEAEWVSDDEGIASVDDAGSVTGVDDGDTDVTATYEGVDGSAQVTVSDDPEQPPEDPVGLVVTPDESTIGVDGVVQLEATAVYDDDSEQPVTDEADWVSGDPEVASVDDEGLVVGVAEGATEVTATFDDVSDSASVTVDAEVEPGPEGLERISAEPGRVEVAIAASEHRFDDGEANTVVLARADEYPDALAGTTLAAEVDAPLLLTSSDELLGNVADEIDRVLGDEGLVYLTGGTEALDDTVEDAVDDLGYTLTRLGGQTRFETAGLIADELGERSQVLVTTGLDFPDALTAGAAAAAHDGVVLLSADEDPHEVVDDYLDGFDGPVTAVGGPATRAYPDAEAVMGQTRDETAVAVAEAFFDEPAAFGVARRDDYPDALAGGAHIAAYEGPLLLSYTEEVPDETAKWLQATEATGGFVYGGTAAIDEDTFDELEELAFDDEDDNDDEDQDNDDGE